MWKTAVGFRFLFSCHLLCSLIQFELKKFYPSYLSRPWLWLTQGILRIGQRLSPFEAANVIWPLTSLCLAGLECFFHKVGSLCQRRQKCLNQILPPLQNVEEVKISTKKGHWMYALAREPAALTWEWEYLYMALWTTAIKIAIATYKGWRMIVEGLGEVMQ